MIKRDGIEEARFIMVVRRTLTFFGFVHLFMVVVTLSTLTLGSSFGQDSPLTPGEVVRLWQTVFPNNLDRAANMTTLSFRQGVMKQQWIETQEPLLRGMQLRYGKGVVLYEEVRGDEARVLVRVRVSSWMGSEEKQELYSLVKGPEGLWFVDRVDEYLGDLNGLE